MLIIQQPAKLIELAIGKQNIMDRKKWRLLNFCLKVNYCDKIILWNNLTKELLALSQEEAEFLQNTSFDLDSETMISLAEKWFLVPVNHNDILLSQQVTALSRQLERNRSIIGYTILPTTACNARCFYCFETGVKPISMSEYTAKKTADFIIENSGENEVLLSWFGGEPLCNTKAIDIITSNLRNNKITYKSTMVTNGFLFNDINVYKAKNDWNLSKVQITIDGTEQVYNTVKNFIYKDVNPFKIVISNIISLLSNGINVSVRLNMDNHNIKDLSALVDYLFKVFDKYGNFSVYTHLLFENTGLNASIRSNEERDYLATEMTNLNDRIEKYGMASNPRKLNKNVKNYACMADNPRNILILPNGKFGRCEHISCNDYLGYDFKENNSKIWNEYISPQKKCAQCECFPECLVLKGCSDHNGECYDYQQQLKKNAIIKSIIKACDDFYNTADDSVC